VAQRQQEAPPVVVGVPKDPCARTSPQKKKEMPATNAVLHDARYRADGVFCEPPKKLDPVLVANAAAETKAAASQSRWNTGDYHWEERDVLAFARSAAADALTGPGADAALWSDSQGNALEIVDVRLEGDAASNVRKGARILTYALVLVVECRGARNGARLAATLETAEFCHDYAAPPAVSLTTTPLESDAGVAVDRAMKAHEMFAKVLKKKAVPRVAKAVADLRAHLKAHKG